MATLNEILAAAGLQADQITSIGDQMKENHIYTAGEENLDIRYGKLRTEHAGAQQTIKELKEQAASVAELTAKLEQAEKVNADLRTDFAVTRALMDAHVSDIDYCKFKLRQNHPDGFTIGEDGKIEGIQSMLDDMKVQLPTQFAGAQKQVVEHKLERSDDKPTGITAEQFSKMDYHKRAALFKDDPEQYAALTKED